MKTRSNTERFRIVKRSWRGLTRGMAARLPQGLYGRSLLIIVLPMVILQSVIAFTFMERHWQTVTHRLSAAVTQDIAAIIEVLESYPQDKDFALIERIASDSLKLSVSVLPAEPLPAPGPKPFFSLLDQTLSREITEKIGRPFWIDTVGRSNIVEIRIQLKNNVLRVFARRSQTYASNSHIFLMWMIGTSLVLIIVAMLFLRNQIKPIQTLANAAEQFGKGRNIGDFKPRGAREVRQAAQAFLQMRARIERQIEQRTTMLSGVSHDLRTILTRFRLQLALFAEDEQTDDLQRDVDAMQNMLEDYLSFARGDSGERVTATDLPKILAEIEMDAVRAGGKISIQQNGAREVHVRPGAFKRCIENLVNNAIAHEARIELTATHKKDWLTIYVDDDGPGISIDKRDEVFRPFYRLDTARNQDRSSTGLGLAIARDIARGHGGDIILEDSPIGGLRATVRFPA